MSQNQHEETGSDKAFCNPWDWVTDDTVTHAINSGGIDWDNLNFEDDADISTNTNLIQDSHGALSDPDITPEIARNNLDNLDIPQG